MNRSDEFEEFFQLHYAKVLRFAESFLGFGAADADDVIAGSLLKAWQWWDRVEPEKRTSWLYRVVRNACLDRLDEPTPAEFDQDLMTNPGPESEVVTRDLVESILAFLPDRLADCIECLLEGHSQQECAEQMGVTYGYFRNLLVRARNEIRTNFGLDLHL